MAEQRSIHPALDALDDVVEQRYRDQERKIEDLRTQGQLMKIQSRFTREINGPNPAADYAVRYFASQAKVKHTPGTGSARNIAEGSSTQRRPRTAARGASATRNSDTGAPASFSGRQGRGEVHQKCEVLNCEIEFSSLGRYIDHTQEHKHQPCHPARHLINGELVNEAPLFCCTTCGNLYKTADTCLTHMEETGHDHLQEPVPVPGFICLHCFLVFPNAADCRMHQHKENHWSRENAMPDDSGRPEPQFIPTPVYEAFVQACLAVPSTVECLDCGVTLHDSTTSQSHSGLGHQVMSLTEKTPAEVWPTLMCDYTCVQCQRIYQELPPDGLGAIHECSPTMAGMIVESDVKSTFDFILRKSLSHIRLMPEVAEAASNTAEAAVTSIPDEVPNDPGGDDSIIIVDDIISSPFFPGQKKADKTKNSDDDRTKSRPARSVSVEIIECFSPERSKTTTKKQKQSQPCVEVDSNNSLNRRSLRDTVLNNSNSSPEDICISSKKAESTGTGSSTKDYANKPKLKNASPPVASTSKQADVCNICTANQWRDPKRRSLPPDCTCCLNDKSKNADISPKKASQRNSASGALSTNNMPGTPPDSEGLTPPKLTVTATLSGDKRKRKVKIKRSAKKKRKLLAASGSQEAMEILLDNDESRNERSVEIEKPAGKSHSAMEVASDSEESGNEISMETSPTPAVKSPEPTQSRGPPILKNLDDMRHIIFVDFDNWMGFFQRLLQPLPDRVFVWGFYGGGGQWKTPHNSVAYQKAVATKCFYLNDKCGRRKDAADFAICMHVGRMDARLPEHIPFTILSGDKGFEEVERQMASSRRRVQVINPHHQQADELYTLLLSVVEV